LSLLSIQSNAFASSSVPERRTHCAIVRVDAINSSAETVSASPCSSRVNVSVLIPSPLLPDSGSPETRDRIVAGQPDLSTPRGVREKPINRGCTPRSAGDATVQADRHHLRDALAFLMSRSKDAIR